MAQAVLKRSDEPEVRELARAIENSQKAEIKNMKATVDEKVGNSAQVELEPANGSQTTGKAILSRADGGGVPKHVNVHKPGSGEPPLVTCADLNEAV